MSLYRGYFGVRGVDPLGTISINCICMHMLNKHYIETFTTDRVSWALIQRTCRQACSGRKRGDLLPGFWTGEWHYTQDQPPNAVIKLISGHDFGRFRKMCLSITNPISADPSCALCDKDVCMNEIDRLVSAIPLADHETTMLEATPGYQIINGYLLGNEIHGGYCHAWAHNFGKSVGKIDGKSCLKLIKYQIDMSISTTAYSDHGFNVILSRCSGKCMIVQNYPFPRVIDPCDWQWKRSHFSNNVGLDTWNHILKSCNCGYQI